MMKKRYSINLIQEIVKDRQLKLISTEYTDGKKPHKWKCLKCNHLWMTSPFNVLLKKTGCPKCAGNARSTIEDMHNIANNRNGECLSTEYVNSYTKLQWKCRDGHVWWAVPSGIKSGRWCSICKNSLVEEKCRFILESFTKIKFPKTRTALGNKWELDGFCEKLALAFEYQGVQHYNRVKKWYTLEKFEQLQERDKQKSVLCRQRGIKKINIPYYEADTNVKLTKFIERWLKQNNIEIKGTILWDNFIHYPSKLNAIQSLAKNRNIECLSTSYDTRMKFKCHCGYIWDTKVYHFKDGHGCPRCAGCPKYTIEDMKALAKQKNGFCRSMKYKNEVTKLIWECCCGNIWKANPHNVKLGKWCPKCGRKRMWETRRRNEKKRQENNQP